MIVEMTALDQLFAKQYDELLDRCRRLVAATPYEPEEIIHGAYLRSRRGYRAERCSPEHPLAYLQRAIESELADRRRRDERRRRRERESAKMRRPWHEATPLRIAAARDSLELLRGRPMQVSRAVLAGMSRDEACRQLRLSMAAFAVHLCRARAILKHVAKFGCS